MEQITYQVILQFFQDLRLSQCWVSGLQSSGIWRPCNLLGGQVYKCFAGTSLSVMKNVSSQTNELLAQVASSRKWCGK